MELGKLFPTALCSAILAVSLSAAQVPRKSPEFAINTTTGKQILLSEHRGKVVALMFILTGCPHCQETTKMLSKLQQEYGSRGFQVLTAAIEDTAGRDVPLFIRQFRPTFPVGFAHRLSVGQYLQHSPSVRMMMPQLVFVDRNGMIRAQHSGDDPFFGEAVQEKNLRNTIESLLKSGQIENAAGKAGKKRG
jgi:thiol-disulfide isomerase/thioredoxin